MPTIHWYPGHIAKAERRLKEQTGLVDVVIEVIDARIPFSSKYEGIERLIGSKPRILLVNKSDLSSPEKTAQWITYLKETTMSPVILTSSMSAKDISSVVKEAIEAGKPSIDKLVAKGLLPRPVRAMVIGMPNVGKSSIINKLIKTAKVKTGAKAGVTRTTQWVRIHPKLELLDTPGIIPMKLDDQDKAAKLAVVNSVSENAYDYIEIAQELLRLIYERAPKLLLEYYKIEDNGENPTLESIATARNWIIPGGHPDINRCAACLLNDFRNGKIGRITLEDIPQT